MLSKNLNPDKALIFRITHVDNLPWILEHGLHCRNSSDQDPNFKNIGNPDLMDRRNRREVPVEPGGTLSDYVPFYFTPYSIMLYNIHTGYGGMTRVPNRDIVIMVSSLRKVLELRICYAFTSGHSYPIYAEYFNDLDKLSEIDWDLLQRRDFQNDPDDPGKKDRYQAEALIHDHMPLTALLGIACYDETRASKMKTELKKRQLGVKVIAQPKYYF
ncbi:MAG: DUF4433 domain-containing protein [Verrucomicrobiales bacterium]|nr:DUF4433 domain-containing protein [Verrucomicrobiales bacterium]